MPPSSLHLRHTAVTRSAAWGGHVHTSVCGCGGGSCGGGGGGVVREVGPGVGLRAPRLQQPV
jgi:hypothetical protein